MPNSNLLESILRLQKFRVRDALGLPTDGIDVHASWRELLHPLFLAAESLESEFGILDSEVLDAIVSLALVEVDEEVSRSIVVVLLCLRVMTNDGQFARIGHLVSKLENLEERLGGEHRFMKVALLGLAKVLRFDSAASEYLSTEIDSFFDELQPDNEEDSDRLHEILMVTILQVALDGDDNMFVSRSRVAALETNDGILLAFCDVIMSWDIAVKKANPVVVLSNADPTFDSIRLRTYLERRQIPVLYPAQIMAIKRGVTLDEDRLVSLPTSSGKTLLAEFRIVATLIRNPGKRALYISPYRLLARQVEKSFTRGLKPLDIGVRDLGSGFDHTTFSEEGFAFPMVSVCTPERLDALLRIASTDTIGGSRASELFEDCAVLVFDEIQLMGRPGRGPRFELILTRLKLKYPNIRILGLAAASQGVEAVSEWLTGNPEVSGATRPTGTLELVWKISGDLVQRSKPDPHVVGRLPRERDAKTSAVKLISRISKEYWPVLSVMIDKQMAESLAGLLKDNLADHRDRWSDSLSSANRKLLGQAVQEVRALMGASHPLASEMEVGVAYHHAGLPTAILELVEQLANSGAIRIVCATTTMAEGADLPFRAVVLPHLNFQGESRRLTRDLYLNIIGRAGRANVAVEGLVIIIDSDAATLRQLVRTSLWSNNVADRARGRLAEISTSLGSIIQWTAFHEVQSQMLGWLGDGQSYVEDQAEAFGQQTYSWQSGSAGDQDAVKNLFAVALSNLEDRGYALAASPYRLTSRGNTARLMGLSAPTALRLERVVDLLRERNWFEILSSVTVLSAEVTKTIAEILFEGLEVVKHGLWLRRAEHNFGVSKDEAFLRLSSGDDSRYYSSEDYEFDKRLLAAWIQGQSYSEIASRAPIYNHPGSLFGGSVESKRTSDAADYISNLNYSAGWVWSGVRLMAEELGETVPAFIKDAITYGLPTEASTQLGSVGYLTRSSAIEISSQFGSSWREIVTWLDGTDVQSLKTELALLGVPERDASKMVALKRKVNHEDF